MKKSIFLILFLLCSSALHSKEVKKYKVIEVDVLWGGATIKFAPNEIFYDNDDIVTLELCPKLPNYYKSIAIGALISAQGNGLLVSPETKLLIESTVDMPGVLCLDKIKIFNK